MRRAVQMTVLLSLVSPASAGAAPRQKDAGVPAPRGVQACSSLSGTAVPPSAIGLPSSGGTIAAATPVEAHDRLPDFCQLTGEVLAADRADPPIRFQVNLPLRWNGKAVQFGGGGLNGTVIDGLGVLPGATADDTPPLAEGYVTYGSDSGHQAGGLDARFGLNAQALANYAGESVKRMHDVAAFLIRRHFGRDARRTYYAGGSKGGHEGLVAAQRYPADFDGVVSFYPAAQNQALVTAWYTMWKAAYGRGGVALNGAEQALLTRAVLDACDGLDGAKDGVVANVTACRSAFRVASLRCPDGAAGAACLSDAQIRALEVAATPVRFPFALANRITQAGPFPVFDGANLSGTLFAPDGGAPESAIYYALATPVFSYFVARDPSLDIDRYAMNDHRAQVLKISALYDATSPDLDAFRARGGRLLIVQGTTDMLVPEAMTTAFVDRLRERYGPKLRSFVRYYVQPGYGHGQGSFLLRWDALAALDAWVEQKRPPAKPVAQDGAPATAGRTMPLCEQPQFPRYVGPGSQHDAASYRCTAP